MFTGTADGRVLKLENGEVETVARFGSGACSKLGLLLRSVSKVKLPFLKGSFTCGENAGHLLEGHAQSHQ